MLLFWLSCVPVTLMFAWVAGFGILAVVRSLREQGKKAVLVIFWSLLLVFGYYLSFSQLSCSRVLRAFSGPFSSSLRQIQISLACSSLTE
jgi:hypothetical protein